MSRPGFMVGFSPYWIPKFKSRANKYDSSNMASSSNYDDGTSSSNHNNGCKWTCFILAFSLLCTIIVVLLNVSAGPSRNDSFMPEFQVNSLEITSMKIYNTNTTSYDRYSIVGDRKQKHITSADVYFNMTLKNKDRKVMYFNPMQVSLQYHNDDDEFQFLSSTVLEPYFLMEYQREFRFGMGIKEGDDDDDARLRNNETVVDWISRDLWGENVVQFALKAQGDGLHWLRGRGGGFKICGINVLCDGLKVGFLPPDVNNLTSGSLILSPILCKSKFDCHVF